MGKQKHNVQKPIQKSMRLQGPVPEWPINVNPGLIFCPFLYFTFLCTA